MLKLSAESRRLSGTSTAKLNTDNYNLSSR